MEQDQQAGHPSEENALTEQAAAWFLRMQQSDANDVEQKAFEAWLAENEAHRTEYQQYVQLWQTLDHLEQKPRKKSRSTVTWIVALAILFGSLHWLTRHEEMITTAIGEHQQIILADGTTIDINTDSTLRLALYGFTRKVTLERGEALFRIGDERLRSFEVHVGNGILRDIGTEFNVIKEEGNVTVAVLEGAVEVGIDHQNDTVRLLHGGEQLTYSAHGLSEISSTDKETITAWRKSRLIFRETPLEEVIRQINRYHSRPVRLGDPQLNTLRVSGEFNSADRAGLVQALITLLPLRASELDSVTLLTYEK